MNVKDRLTAVRVYADSLDDLSQGAAVLGYSEHAVTIEKCWREARADVVRLERDINQRLAR